ncbi:MAG: MbnP family copper-binding protein [Polyangia bacterium]
MKTTLILLVAGGSLWGCGGTADRTYTVSFDAVVGAEPFSCTKTYANIGTPSTTISPQDFRLYTYGYVLERANGESVPLTLDDDGTWQGQGVALLDFEDGTGTCTTNNPATHTKVTGKAAAHDDYTSLSFTIGVPPELDHLNVVTAAAPLADPNLFWSWNGGYRYWKLDVQSTVNPTYFFHIGAEDCAGSGGPTVTCTYPYLATINVAGFSPDTNHVAIDLARVYAGSNLDAQVDGTIDPVTGCMSSDGDPECNALFGTLGLGFEGAASPGPQTVFTAR